MLSACAVLSSCGQDYSVKAQPDNNLPPDSGAPSEPVVVDASTFSSWCPEEDSLPDAAAINEDCDKEVVTGSIEAVIEWEVSSWSNYGEYSQIVMAPVVGQLDDENGDGVVSREDVPDIVVITDDEGEYEHKKGILRIIPGDGTTASRASQRFDTEVGDTVFQVYPYRYSNVALGDVDDDGEAEIVFIAQVFEGPPGGGVGEDGVPGESLPPPDTFEGPPAPTGGGPEETGIGDGGEGDDGGEDGDEEVPILPGLEPPPMGDEGDCYVAAVTPDLQLDWVALDAGIPCGGHAPAIADLEADGNPEVVVGDFVLSGLDGSVLWQGGAGVGAYDWHPETGFHPVPADLDGDGFMEVITGRSIYDYSGNTLCDAGSEEDDGYVAVADLDMDGEGEVIAVGNGTARVFGMDCIPTATWPIAGLGNGGPPTIADFDGDAEPEIGIASGTRYAVYEPDGTELWSVVVADESSASTGSSTYDFEGDGRAEVVYADEARMWIFDGATGDIRYEGTHHASRTLHEFPTVADVDGDGLPEIVVPNGGGHQGENKNGLVILGSANLDWLPGRQVWNQHAFSLTNINDDLTVPAPAAPNWPLHNNFRSGDPQPVSGSDAPDVVPLAELCLEECERNTLVVRIRLGNEGAAILRRDVPVSVYARSSDGTRTYLGSSFTISETEPGETTDTIVLRVDWTGFENHDLVVVADDEEGIEWVPECVESNNEYIFASPDCSG
jgi:hypothetical protein